MHLHVRFYLTHLQLHLMTMTMTSLLRKGTYILFTQVYNKYMIKYLQKDQVPKLKPK